MNRKRKIIEEERRMILETIDASRHLAEKLGKHPVTKGCNCISCVNKRKRLLNRGNGDWEFEL